MGMHVSSSCTSTRPSVHALDVTQSIKAMNAVCGREVGRHQREPTTCQLRERLLAAPSRQTATAATYMGG